MFHENWWWFMIYDNYSWWFMIHDDLWWCMMIYDDVWWFMMIYDESWLFLTIYDDLWWSMMIYDDSWWFVMYLCLLTWWILMQQPQFLHCSSVMCLDFPGPCSKWSMKSRTPMNWEMKRWEHHVCITYPLVNKHSELENGHRNSGFSHWKWWFEL